MSGIDRKGYSLDVSDIADQVILDTDQMVDLFSSDRVNLGSQNGMN